MIPLHYSARINIHAFLYQWYWWTLPAVLLSFQEIRYLFRVSPVIFIDCFFLSPWGISLLSVCIKHTRSEINIEQHERVTWLEVLFQTKTPNVLKLRFLNNLGPWRIAFPQSSWRRLFSPLHGWALSCPHAYICFFSPAVIVNFQPNASKPDHKKVVLRPGSAETCLVSK